MSELEPQGVPEVTDSASLERRYRRLLAWYPKSFRRENEEEILSVLLACAQDGQQRPGLAASVDLIKGAILMRLRPASRPPRSVLAAVRLMCAGAAAELAVLITVIATAGQMRSAVAHRYPVIPGLQHAVTVHLVVDDVGMPIMVGLWLLLAWVTSRGHDAARLAFAAFFALITMCMLAALGQGVAIYAPAALGASAAEWVIALAAAVLLFVRASNRYYRRPLAAAAPWGGTFGTM